MKKLTELCLAVLLVLSVTAANAAAREIVAHKQGASLLLPNAGDYLWWYGCSPTAAGMALGTYDLNGYTNLVPGGDAELNSFGNPGALVNNMIASPGHITDFYAGLSPGAGYENTGDDLAAPWHSFNSLADFMGTSRDIYGNPNGITTFYYFTDGYPLAAVDVLNYGVSDSSGMFGIYEYINYAGYEMDVLYNQYIDTLGLAYGFTFEQYMNEIDAGRPVIMHVNYHNVLGYGYDSATNTVFVHDTWNPGQHSMTWGGSYNNLAHFGVTVMQLTAIPEPATSLLVYTLLSVLLIRHNEK